MVVVADERVDLRFKASGQEAVLQQDAVLQSLVPAFVCATVELPDQSLNAPTALRLSVIGPATRVLHAFAREISGEVARDAGRSAVGQQARAVNDIGGFKPRSVERQIERVVHITRRHARSEFPGDDVAGEVIEYRGEIEPPPTDDLQVGEFGLPELVG